MCGVWSRVETGVGWGHVFEESGSPRLHKGEYRGELYP